MVIDQLEVRLVVIDEDADPVGVGVAVPREAVLVDVVECDLVAVCDGLPDTDSVVDWVLEGLAVSAVRLLVADADNVVVGVGVSGGVIVAVSVEDGVGGMLAVEEAVAVQLRFRPA